MRVTKRFGLIGHPLGHSLSPYIHGRIMEEAGIRGTYTLYDMDEAELKNAMPLLLSDLDGLNCTIPYKGVVIPFLDRLDETSRSCGSVNTIYEKTGYNTDRYGFLGAAPSLFRKRVLLLGAGGVSRMMAFEAAVQDAEITICARNEEKRDMLIRELSVRTKSTAIGYSHPSDVEGLDFDVILNGTPVGMWPVSGAMPTSPRVFRAGQDVFDTIYNPAATKWLMCGKRYGASGKNGLSMLLMQAVHAQMIWNPGADICPDKMSGILPELSRRLLSLFPVKYIVTGFMGAGKSVLAKNLGDRLGIPSLDLDREIVGKRGCSIPEIFRRDGEESFRKMEESVLEEMLNRPGSACIAVGGGAVIQEDIQALIQKYQALTVYIEVSFSAIWRRVGPAGGRPLLGDVSGGEDERFRRAAALYEARLPVYESTCDAKVNGERSEAEVTEEAFHSLGYGGSQ